MNLPDPIIKNDTKLLFICSKERTSPEDLIFAKDVLASLSDPLYFVELSSKHGVLPLIYICLKSMDYQQESANILPSHIFDIFKQRYKQVATKNMLMSAEVIKIVKSLGFHKIDVISFKGPLLSKVAYGDITLRQYGDIDLLIRPDKLFQAVTHLESLGYELQASKKLIQNPEWIKSTKDMTLFHPRKGIVVELHWKLFQSSFANTSFDPWDYTQIVEFNRTDIKVFQPELLLAYLCIHGSRHLWERIEWIVDVDRLVRNSSINWNLVLELSSGFEGTKMLLLGLNISKIFFDTPLPKFVLKRIDNKKISILTEKIIPLIENPITNSSESKDVFRRKMLHIGMQETFSNELKLLFYTLFQPHYGYILKEGKGRNILFRVVKPFKIIKKLLTSN